MSTKSWSGFVGVFVAAVLFLALPHSAFAQNCALCYTQAASTGARMIQALRSGILILIIPPTLGTIGLFFVVHRRTNQFKRADDSGEPEHDW
jgi:hypothetical protein